MKVRWIFIRLMEPNFFLSNSPLWLYHLSILEQLHQFVQIFCLFCKEKPTFSILYIHFYKILTSVYLFYTFIQQNIHSFYIFFIISFPLLSGTNSQIRLLHRATPTPSQPPFNKILQQNSSSHTHTHPSTKSPTPANHHLLR